MILDPISTLLRNVVNRTIKQLGCLFNQRATYRQLFLYAHIMRLGFFGWWIP